MASRSAVVLPDDSAQPILDAIRAAKRSIRVKMFVFSDQALVRALVAAQRRRVKVQVMLNSARRSGEEENASARRALGQGGIEVTDANPDFDLTHEKSMVVDEETAFVKSLNWSPKNFTSTRDYAIVTSHMQEVREIVDCFEADWKRQRFTSGPESHLIWCPGGRDAIGRFIDRAKHTLFLQNERYQDTVIIEHLVRASRRGVRIHVMTRPPHTLKEEKLVEGVGGLRILDDVGIKIHRLKHLRLHAKMFLADGDRRLDQPGPWKPRPTPRAGHRSSRRRGRRSAAPGGPPRLEALASARPVRRRAARRSRGTRGRSEEARRRPCQAVRAQDQAPVGCRGGSRRVARRRATAAIWPRRVAAAPPRNRRRRRRSEAR